MLPATCVVVPTYWTRAGGAPRSGDAVYDHPTPLDSEGTLPPLLDSLAALGSEFYLLLLVAVTDDAVAEAAEERVREITGRYSGLTTLVFTSAHLAALRGWLQERGPRDAGGAIALRAYPCIRNLQLAVPLLLGTEKIVALDDDEILLDPDFMAKATEPLGSTVDGSRVDGLSGHYLQENGGILLAVDPAKAASPNLFDRKAAIMNAATEMLENRAGNLVETPFCFGGNMEFSADLAAAVGFDPGITRGEDIDYLINARLEGRNFFLRKDLNILHRPPKGGSYRDVNLSKLEQDVIRFLYEREKLRASHEHPELTPLSAKDLDPYPGQFLGPDLEEDSRQALEAAGFEGDASAFVEETKASVSARFDRYLAFRKTWPALTGALREATPIRDELMRDVHGL